MRLATDPPRRGWTAVEAPFTLKLGWGDNETQPGRPPMQASIERHEAAIE